MEIEKSVILAALQDADVEDTRWGYSGRGMYGRTCFGFVGSMDQYGRFLIALVQNGYYEHDDIEEGGDVAKEFADRVSTDSMGYDTIFYFPGIQVLENE